MGTFAREEASYVRNGWFERCRRIYNIGNNRPVNLMDYIEALEKSLGKKTEKAFLPIQPGDVPDSWANVDDLVEQFDYQPQTPVEQGVANFANWFKDYYG